MEHVFDLLSQYVARNFMERCATDDVGQISLRIEALLHNLGTGFGIILTNGMLASLRAKSEAHVLIFLFF